MTSLLLAAAVAERRRAEARQARLGRPLREVLPGLAPRLEPLHRQVLETGEPVLNVDICGEKPAAPAEQGVWVASYYPVRARDGPILGVGAVVLEVTERQRAEEARARLAAIVASSDDTIVGKTLEEESLHLQLGELSFRQTLDVTA